MYANLKFIQEGFAKFNHEIFAGTLPRIPLRIGSSRRTLGSLRYRKSRRAGKTIVTDFTLTISARFDLTQDVIEDTLIHEMIHLYIFINNLTDTSAHGNIFRTMMDTINKRHNRHITISHRSSTTEAQSDTMKRNHYILLSKFKTGETYITLISRTKIFDMQRSLLHIKEIESWEWRYSTDPHFNRYPRSRSLKFYKISPETFKHLPSTRLCVCDGHTFRLA